MPTSPAVVLAFLGGEGRSAGQSGHSPSGVRAAQLLGLEFAEGHLGLPFHADVDLIIRDWARSCSILGLASLRLDDFLCSRLLGPAPDGGIQFAMTFDKRHKRGMVPRTHRRMERRVDARAPARRACRGLPIPQLQVQARRRQQAIPEQQARLRSGQPDHRPRLRWHGPRHLLIQIAELIGHHRQRATRGSPAGPARHAPKCSAP
ncbi:hypothetical protein T492DRAFT_1098519 [Pavlovales sp. CCMP2436]|nr:hypothetical protein T492DRAFT_1098519 [Pavlovales sp. CCMP2436]